MRLFSYTIMVFVVFCFTVNATSSRYYDFGYDGRDGWKGTNGQNGMNGPSAEIMVDGSSLSLELSGTSGGDGYDGEYGENARSCYPPHDPPYDLRGADGGDGGDGGRGGYGGSAGDLTVYFDDINHLRSVYVRAIPGRGGRGGYGNQGGRQCYCNKYSWRIYDSNGNYRTYYCSNGQQGRNGFNGFYGTDGTSGKVTLINQLTPLKPTTSNMWVKMEQMESGSYELSLNNWSTKTGTTYLFAPGSQLNNSYKEFAGRVEAGYAFQWDVPRPLTDFSGKMILLNLQNGKVVPQFPSDVWHEGVETLKDHPSYVYLQAIHQGEALNLAFNSLNGFDSNLTAVVTDTADVSGFVNSKFHVEYYTRRLLGYVRRYHSDVSEELIIRNGNEFRISVGKLPINPKFLRSGINAYVKFTINRSFGGKNADAGISLKAQIQ